MKRAFQLLFDIRIVIFILFFLRLQEVNLPPTDAHAWRQTQTLGVSRNFIEYNSHPFEPSNIVCDSRTGIMGQEFPVMNYLISAGWKIFGQKTWVWRLLTLIINSLGLWWFYLFMKNWSSEATAYSSTCVLGASLFFMYSTKAMPDVFSISLILGSLYYSTKYLQNQNKEYINLILSCLLLSLGLLSKMPAAVSASLISIPILLRNKWDNKILKLIGVYFIALVATYFWYYVWNPHLVSKYGFNIIHPASFKLGWSQIENNMGELREKFSYKPFVSYIHNIFLFSGLIVGLFSKFKLSYIGVLLSILLFFVFALKTGILFIKHEYYWLPIIPTLSIIVGWTFHYIYKNIGLYYIIPIYMLMTLSIKNQWWDFNISPKDKKFIKLESIVNSVVPKDSRIITNDDMISPRMMYFAHRRGWNDKRFNNKEWVLGEHTVGLDYMVLDKARLKDEMDFPILFEDEDFIIYKVE